MQIFIDEHVDAANVFLELPAPGEDSLLRDDVIVTVDDGRITALELLNVSQYGTPFDEAAAERLLVWAREQLDARAAS
jgi:hypothetical protein